MKKIISILLVLIMILGFTACGKDLVGVWQIIDGNSYVYEYILNEDGTYSCAKHGERCTPEKLTSGYDNVKYEYETGTYATNFDGSISCVPNDAVAKLSDETIQRGLALHPYRVPARDFNNKIDYQYRITPFVLQQIGDE